MAELGESYRDGITGWCGTATAQTTYLNGNVKVCLERPGKEGHPTEHWIDECRLEPTADGKSGRYV